MARGLQVTTSYAHTEAHVQAFQKYTHVSWLSQVLGQVLDLWCNLNIATSRACSKREGSAALAV